MSQLERRLKPLQLSIKGIPADGNCLYRAVIDQLYETQSIHRHAYPKDGTEEPYRVLRNAVGTYMGSRGYTYMPFMAIPEHLSSQERVSYKLLNYYYW